MAKKKKKSVLEYDPLAWLKDSDSAGVEPLEKKSKVKKEAKKTVKKAVKKAAKTTVKKKVKSKPVENIIDDTDNEGFGLFADEPEISKTEEPASDEGFGFFTDDDNSGLEEKNMETLAISNEDAINLGSELTIKTVAEMKAKMDEIMSADEDIVINAEEMIKIDTAGLQLLYSLKETLGQTGHHIKWIGTSTVINDSAEMIGMPILAPKSKDACFGFFEENMPPKDADDGSSGFF